MEKRAGRGILALALGLALLLGALGAGLWLRRRNAPAPGESETPAASAPASAPAGTAASQSPSAPAPEETAPPALVDLGGTLADLAQKRLALAPGTFDPALLLAALREGRLAPEEIDLGLTDLDAATLDALRAALGERGRLRYQVALPGRTVDGDSWRVDLTGLESGELDAALEALRRLPALRELELSAGGVQSALTKAELRRLMDELPGVEVHAVFDLLGLSVSTLDEEVRHPHAVLRDADEAEIRAALDILPRCRYFCLDADRRGISNEIMGQIRADYPATKVVWRVFFDQGASCLTDEEVLRLAFVLNDRNSGALRYCNDAVYLDIGHNSPVTDLSFIAQMPRLQCAVCSSTNVSDLSPFMSCPDLTWLELCYCQQVEDLSPLAELPSLKYLNVSYTAVKELSALTTLPLERFLAMGDWTTIPEREAFVTAHPDCLTAFTGTQPYGYPWRYNAGVNAASNFFSYYARMREVFLYDDREYYYSCKYSDYGPGYLRLREGNLVFGTQGQGG